MKLSPYTQTLRYITNKVLPLYRTLNKLRGIANSEETAKLAKYVEQLKSLYPPHTLEHNFGSAFNNVVTNIEQLGCEILVREHTELTYSSQ